MRMLRRGLNSPFGASNSVSFRQGFGFFPAGLFLAENISDTPRGVDELGVSRVALYLLTEVADVDIDRALVAELVPPYPAQKGAAREHPAGARGEGHEQLELRVGEVHLLAVGRHPAAGEVDPQPVVRQLVWALARRDRCAAHDRPHPRHEFPDGEGLGHVVVRTELQADDPIYLVVAGGKHYDGHVALRPDPPYDLRAIELGEHDVENDQVRLVHLERFERGFPIARNLDLETLALEGVREHLLERRLVVDEKTFSRHSL